MKVAVSLCFIVLTFYITCTESTNWVYSFKDYRKKFGQVKQSHLSQNLISNIKTSKNISSRFSYRRKRDFFIRRYISNRNKVIFRRRSAYPVCKRPYSTYEMSLVKKLVKLRKKGLDLYRKNHQKCAVSRDKRDIQSEFAGINIVPTLQFCTPRRTTESNTLTMCTECFYDILLPQRFYPRSHIHVTCHNNTDFSCFLGGGTCMKNTASIPLLYDTNEVGFDKLSQWTPINLQFTKSCSCQIIKGSLFDPFV